MTNEVQQKQKKTNRTYRSNVTGRKRMVFWAVFFPVFIRTRSCNIKILMIVNNARKLILLITSG